MIAAKAQVIVFGNSVDFTHLFKDGTEKYILLYGKDVTPSTMRRIQSLIGKVDDKGRQYVDYAEITTDGVNEAKAQADGEIREAWIKGDALTLKRHGAWDGEGHFEKIQEDWLKANSQ